MPSVPAFPRPPWEHLRATNPAAPSFATVWLRTTAPRRFKKGQRATMLIWKALLVAEGGFRRLDAPGAAGRGRGRRELL